MDELVKIVNQFNTNLDQQINVYRELETILDYEEKSLAEFHLTEFEKILIEKDQNVQRLLLLNTKREALLTKLCYFISYDTRRGLPSLVEFQKAFDTYLKNIKDLVEEETYNQVNHLAIQFKEVAHRYREVYVHLTPRFYRNQQILRQMTRSFSQSVAIFESALPIAREYNKKGTSTSKPVSLEAKSKVYVKA